MRKPIIMAAALSAVGWTVSAMAQTAAPAAPPEQAPAEQQGGTHSTPGMTGATPQGNGAFVDDTVRKAQQDQAKDPDKVKDIVKDAVKATEEAPSGVDATKKIPPVTPGP